MLPELKARIFEQVHFIPEPLSDEETQWLADLLAHPNFIKAWQHVIMYSRKLAVDNMKLHLISDRNALEKAVLNQGEASASIKILDLLMGLATIEEKSDG